MAADRDIDSGLAHWLGKLRTHYPPYHLLIALVISGLIFGAIILTTGWGSPMIALEVRSNFVSYTVGRPAIAAIAVQDAVVSDRDRALLCGYGKTDEKGTRLTARIMPSQGDIVEYVWNKGFAIIRFRSPPEKTGPHLDMQVQKQPICKIDSELSLYLFDANLTEMPPLPLVGPGQIGAELGMQPVPSQTKSDLPTWLTQQAPADAELGVSNTRLLLDGTARVYGRTNLGSDGNLYPIPDSDFNLPRGSRLTTVDGTWLTGTVTLATTGEGFDVRATTEAQQLRLYRIGSQEQAETFATGVLSRAFRDPSAAPILLFVGIFVVVVQILLALAAIEKKGPEG